MRLPEAHTNTSSPYYVPDELRDTYEQLPEVEPHKVREILDRFARVAAWESVPAEESPQDYWQEVESLRARADTQLALHRHYLEEAAREQQKQLKREAKEHKQREASRCPVCSTVTHGLADNPLKRRSLNGEPVEMLERPGERLSCFKCWLVISDQCMKQAAAEKFGRFTRQQLVEQLLSSS